ncbi:FAST kinase domain-containing protein 4-like [Ptychodera flava]|uniref:FAST kinase domain-containing protein 4-like n=1 Tax=Ptychodera flava TaxID=63121 RepID=UPI003969CDFA
MAMVLANKNRRSVPLLRSLGYHIMQRQHELDIQSMLRLSYSLGKLNFHHQQLLEKILAELPHRLAECTPGMVASLAKSFAFLKWLHYPLYNAIAQYTLENLERFKSQNLANLLIAFARLNYQPKNSDAFFRNVISALDSGIDSLNSNNLVDTVWSLAILQQVPNQYLSKALGPEYQEKVSEGVSYQIQSLRLKLLHINTAARLECPDYQGPYLPDEFIKPADALINPGRKATAMQAAILHSLTNTLGGEKFLRSKVLTPYGHKLDAEFLLDADGKALPVDEYETFYSEKDGGTAKTPPNAKRIAVMLWEFQNYCYQSKDLLGRYEMARRHLTKAGYALLEIPYYEWNDLRSEWQRGAYLKDKINKAVAAEVAKK